MTLSLEKKSVYLILFNATMIARSVCKVLTEDKMKQFKRAIFQKVDKLADLMDKGELSSDAIISSIDSLCKLNSRDTIAIRPTTNEACLTSFVTFPRIVQPQDFTKICDLQL